MQRIYLTLKNLQKILPLNPRKIRKIVREVFLREGAGFCGEVAILFVDDRQIRAFNTTYAGKDASTDVLAFDSSFLKNELLADVIVSVETAARNARVYRCSCLYEVYLYVVHGLLHLVGYNDATVSARRKMQRKATLLLHSLKIKTKHR